MSEKKSSPIVNNEEIERIIQQLPKNDYLWNETLYQWEGFWSTLAIIKAVQVFKATFKSEPNDILLASSMKTGSTWLKAICVSIMQGDKEEEEDLLVKDNPHFHVPTIEAMDYYSKTPTHDLYTMPSPRLFHTHLPYRYEDLKIDPKKEVAKIALFLGKPFGNEEDLEIVLKKCSLERLKNLEVNKSGSIFTSVHNNAFFRKGVVGDWKNHMTPEMEAQLDKITKLKLQGSGLEL
ncbi:hypothetical protein KY285_011018 [Solanum tuberosum]|nr:hypothetical protein KY285_011018 [Solanum tuberosum]